MVFDPLKDVPSLEGKVIIVTGGNTGIGAATIKYLIRQNPSRIFLCARPVSKPQGEAVAASLKTSFPEVDVLVRGLDLSSLESVKEFSAEFLRETDRLDMLILNAGISTTAPALTEDGYESQFGVNYLGHALLTQLLIPRLLETQGMMGGDVRVLVTSSTAAVLAPPETGLALDSMRDADALASPYQRYAHSKLACILFARKLAQRYPSVLCVAVDPGQVKTDLFKKATGINWWFLMTVGMLFMHLTGVHVDKGAENGLWALATQKEELRNGAYYEPVGKLVKGKGFVEDSGLMDKLWDWTDGELRRFGAPGWVGV